MRVLRGLLLLGVVVCASALTIGWQRRPAPPHRVIAPQAPPRPATPLVADFAVPVLMYHRICDLSEREARSPLMRDLTVSPADFARQLQYLADNRFTILTAEEVEAALRKHRPLPERAVAITMDDGYRDNFACAFPLLQQYRAKATVFLVTSVVGDVAHLTWEDARRMQRERCGFQSHTVHHFDLTALGAPELDSELREAKRTIEAQLSTPVTEVAYPSGAFNDSVVNATRQAGYQIGWKKGGGPVTPDCDPLRLPRIRVHGRTDMTDFERKVWSGVYTREARHEG